MSVKFNYQPVIYIFLFFICVFIGSDSFSQTSRDEIWSRFRKEKSEIMKGPGLVRKEIGLIQKDIRKRNLKFRVKITEMMKYKISAITGNEVPGNIEKK